MSILIKGIKMPKEGNYEARLNICKDGTALLFLRGECGGHEAKELPPHGRLIDADKARKDEEIFWDLDTTHRKYEDTVGDIFDRQPTIIEAEAKE